METVFTEIEAILNSRPITPMSDDPNEFKALTPGHFLIGEPLISTIDQGATEFKGNLQERWKAVSSLREEFWRRWTKEYLTELQHRHKWKQSSSNIKPGTMVIIHEDNLPSLKWKLGRIIRPILGEDGLVRVAEVKTASGTIKRAIHRLAPLPVANSEAAHEVNGEDNEVITLHISNRDDKHPRRSQKRSSSGSQKPSYWRHGLSPTTLLGILLLLISPIFAQSTINIEPFPTQPGLYFERLGLAHLTTADWNLVVYFNMTPYWTEYNNIQQGIKIASDYCSRLNHLLSCHTTIRQFRTKLTDIQSYHQIVRPPKHFRTRRYAPLGIIGNLANALFGVLDSGYAEDMSKVINDLHNNEDYLLNLLKNNTSILDATTNILTRTNDELQTLDKALDKTQQQIRELASWSHEHKRAEVFNALSLQLSLSIAEYQKTQELLVEVLTDSHKSKVHPLLVTPQQLHQQLNIMKTHIPSLVRVPGHGLDIAEIYKLLTIEGRATDAHIIFRLTLPLFGIDDFELLHVVSVPTHIGNGSFVVIQNTAEFLLTDLHRNQFYPLPRHELYRCANLRTTGYICKQHHPIYRISSPIQSCEMSFLRNEPQLSFCDAAITTSPVHWIQLMEENTVIYISYPERAVIRLCGTSISQTQLLGTGRIKIEPYCVLKDDSTTITARSAYATSMITSLLPKVNFVEVISSNQSWQISSNHLHRDVNISTHLRALRKRIEDLQQAENQSLKKSIPEHYHLGISLSTLLIVIIMISVLVVRSWIKHRLTTMVQPPIPTPRSHRDFEIHLDDSY